MTPLVPAYIWPTDDAAWDRALAGPPGIVVVTGDNSGAGSVYSADLAARIRWCVARGWQPIGYVALSYGQRAAATITAEVRRWRTWYPQTVGTFFDEFPAADLELASMLTELVRRTGKVGVLNPGGPVPEGIWGATWPTGSNWPCRMITVTFEGPLAAYDPGRAQVHPRAAHLVYDAPVTPLWPVGLQWGTSTPDGADGNPWDASLPSPWRGWPVPLAP